MSTPKPLDHAALVRTIREQHKSLRPVSPASMNDYLQRLGLPTAHVEPQYSVPGVLVVAARNDLELHKATKALRESGLLPAGVGVVTVPEYADLVVNWHVASLRNARTRSSGLRGLVWRAVYAVFPKLGG